MYVVQAFHLKFVEQKLESNVGKWNVHVMQLSETKRHMDRAALLKFWEVLDRSALSNYRLLSVRLFKMPISYEISTISLKNLEKSGHFCATDKKWASTVTHVAAFYRVGGWFHNTALRKWRGREVVWIQQFFLYADE